MRHRWLLLPFGSVLVSWPLSAFNFQVRAEAGAPLHSVQFSIFAVERQLSPFGKTQCSSNAPVGGLIGCLYQCCG